MIEDSAPDPRYLPGQPVPAPQIPCEKTDETVWDRIPDDPDKHFPQADDL